MSQEEQLQAIVAHIKNIGEPAIVDKIYGSLRNFKENEFKPQNTVQVGDKLPDLVLLDHNGKDVTGADLKNMGHVLITFYRGSWCPYCNVAVQFLQRHLDDFKSRGVTLVAVTPELADYTQKTINDKELKFPVLTDHHNTLAKKLGLLYDQSAARELHGNLGVDLNARNGEDTWEVPIPATLLVDSSGVVRATHIDPDFTKRLDPKIALEWIDTILKEEPKQ
jgi:peroxiredoxin